MSRSYPPPQPPLVDDDNGHDPEHPHDCHFLPVPRQQRADGWTADAQRRFIEALADSGPVTHAARAAGKAPASSDPPRPAAGERNAAVEGKSVAENVNLG